MKKKILILFLIMLLPLAMSAQKMNIEKMLDGRYKKNPNTTDVVYRGEQMFNLPLEYYHSLTVVNDDKIMNALAEAFLADEEKVTYKELTRVGQHLYFGFYSHRPKGSDYNVFYFIKDMRYAPKDRKKQVVLIMMEGDCSIETIKKVFKK